MLIKYGTNKWIEVQDEIQVSLIRKNQQARDLKFIRGKKEKLCKWNLLKKLTSTVYILTHSNVCLGNTTT